MTQEFTIRCEVTNEVIPSGEGAFLSYSAVVNERGTFKRMNKGLRLGNTLTQAILLLIDEKRNARRSS